jgi:hypothetical protein
MFSVQTTEGTITGFPSTVNLALDDHSKEAYSIKLRYEARASISLGDNVLAIRGMGSAAA